MSRSTFMLALLLAAVAFDAAPAQRRKSRPQKIGGLSWHRTIEDGLAASKGKKGVLWVRMLGELNGGL